MGQGEFDGGGSVTWRVQNSDGDSGSGNKHGAKGKDKDPKKQKDPDARFEVIVNGDLVASPLVDGSRIVIKWPASLFAPAAGSALRVSSVTARSAPTKAAKTTAKKTAKKR